MTLFEMRPLEDVATLLSGGTPSKADPSLWDGDVPWLTPKDMGNWKGKTEKTVTTDAIGSGTRLAPANSVYVAVRGMSLHNEIRIIHSQIPLTFNQDIKAVVAKEGIEPRFLYFSLASAKTQLLNWVSAAGHGTGVLATDRLKSIQIPDVSFSEQKSISSLLGALDDKIELNRRMNETLEAMARAIFKDWFVDFGPIRAKVEGRAPYFAPDIWSLFPDRLDDEDKPIGWNWQALAQIAKSIQRGISPSYIEEGGIPVLNQKCIRDRRIDVTKGRRHDPSKKSTKGRALLNGDILVNSTGVGTLGRTAQVWQPLDSETIVDSHVTILRPDNAITLPLYMGFNITGREDEIENLGEGSTGQTELSRARLGDLSILVPGSQTQEAFEKIASPLVEKIILNDAESRTLVQTRDLLLPKLMSGEIRVCDAETLVENAL